MEKDAFFPKIEQLYRLIVAKGEACTRVRVLEGMEAVLESASHRFGVDGAFSWISMMKTERPRWSSRSMVLLS